MMKKIKLFSKKQLLNDGEVKSYAPDIDFISRISTRGGINFDDVKYVKSGTGYEACITLHGYPKEVNDFWLSHISAYKDTVFCMDISSSDKAQVNQNLRKSLDEQASRVNSARSSGEALDAQRKYSQMERLYNEINSFGEVLKAIKIRLYIPAKTIFEADKKLRDITADLVGNKGYKASVFLDETKSDFRSLFLSDAQQQKTIYARPGQPISAHTLAAGDPFHFGALKDPRGTYFGSTDTGGSVLLDLFRKTERRMSYNFVTFGSMGAGKSTILKKIALDMASKGNYVRVLDPTGEFVKLTKYIGGKVIYLDGSTDSVLNMLQILSDENNALAYTKHINRVVTIYSFLRKDEVKEDELLVLKQLLRVLYRQFNILDENDNIKVDLATMPNESFPILSDLLNLTRMMIEHYPAHAKELFETSNIRESKVGILENIELKLHDLCTTYGNIFNKHTKIDDFYSEKFITFVFNNLIDMEECIYDAQYHNVLSLCYDNGVANGLKMKEAFQEQTIPEDQITRTMILIDEFSRSINTRKTIGVKELETVEREGRKWYIGVGLASQLISDAFPDESSAEGTAAIRNLFKLSTYKFIFHQDESSVEKIRQAFSGTFSENVINKIPTLAQKECFLSIATERVLKFTVWASDEEIYVFDGGQ